MADRYRLSSFSHFSLIVHTLLLLVVVAVKMRSRRFRRLLAESPATVKATFQSYSTRTSAVHVHVQRLASTQVVYYGLFFNVIENLKSVLSHFSHLRLFGVASAAKVIVRYSNHCRVILRRKLHVLSVISVRCISSDIKLTGLKCI